MAWTGSATVKQITDRKVRITGLSLAGDATGTIGFTDKTSPADVSMGALPDWQPYSRGSVDVTLQDAIEVRQTIVTDVTTPVPISVVKTGTTHLDFLISVHNDTAGTAGPALEIWVEFHG